MSGSLCSLPVLCSPASWARRLPVQSGSLCSLAASAARQPSSL